MLGNHIQGDEAGNSETASSALRSSKEGNDTSNARPGEVTPGRGKAVARFVSGIIAHLDKAISPRLQQGDEGRGTCDRISFGEDNSSKQPLLAKVRVTWWSSFWRRTFCCCKAQCLYCNTLLSHENKHCRLFLLANFASQTRDHLVGSAERTRMHRAARVDA